MVRHPLRIVREHDEAGPGGTQPLAFDAFFEAEVDALLRRMWLVTRDRQEAEEVVQDAFLSMFEHWDRIPDIDDPVAYLYRTAFNAWKKRSRRATRAIKQVFAPEPAPDAFAAAEARSVVGDALEHLPPRQRAALILTELVGLSSEEAGQILGIRPVTARVLASQARATMRAHLGAGDE
jgi:RNA polymerase sigma factor (sigma-70 family)